jgi:large subunit ribosomal protein L35
LLVRSFTSSSSTRTKDDVETVPSTEPYLPEVDDLKYAYTRKQVKRLEREQGKRPIGSHRFRVARMLNPDIPFEQLPYQCFQEARKVLAEKREEILKDIKKMEARIERTRALDDSVLSQRQREDSVMWMKVHIQKLKIEADINDPLVKKKFEDDMGK